MGCSPLWNRPCAAGPPQVILSEGETKELMLTKRLISIRAVDCSVNVNFLLLMLYIIIWNVSITLGEGYKGPVCTVLVMYYQSVIAQSRKPVVSQHGKDIDWSFAWDDWSSALSPSVTSALHRHQLSLGVINSILNYCTITFLQHLSFFA